MPAWCGGRELNTPGYPILPLPRFSVSVDKAVSLHLLFSDFSILLEILFRKVRTYRLWLIMNAQNPFINQRANNSVYLLSEANRFPIFVLSRHVIYEFIDGVFSIGSHEGHFVPRFHRDHSRGERTEAVMNHQSVFHSVPASCSREVLVIHVWRPFVAERISIYSSVLGRIDCALN